MRTRRQRTRLADVMRVDDRARVTFAAAAPAGARQHAATIADNAKASGQLFAWLAGSRDAHKATARALGLRDAS